MKINIERSVTVITPSIGSDKLKYAVESVINQTYKNVKHLIVADGPEHVTHCQFRLGDKSPQVVCTPENTGGNGFYGHRIYAAYPHLINSDYIFFLDEDNWYEPDHVKSLVEVLEKEKKIDFSYSFRNIYLEDGTFVCQDNCESLGIWPIWMTHGDPGYLIDTSSFAFRREFIQRTCHKWHSGWGGDRRFLYLVNDAVVQPSLKHTLNYRLDGNPNSVKPEFFLQGNAANLNHYEGKLPWLQKT